LSLLRNRKSVHQLRVKGDGDGEDESEGLEWWYRLCVCENRGLEGVKGEMLGERSWCEERGEEEEEEEAK
jgi:hypothetical protein